ncbi:MAG: hypothetical protein FWC97_02700 [Treponema sp.]|nr:hypothetical protein [Treponema sp.]
MTINKKTSQDFLRLMYLIQNNRSSTLRRIHEAAYAVLTQPVYTAIDHTKGGKPFYSLEPIQDITEENTPMRKPGGRPQSLTDEQKAVILNSDLPHLQLARLYKVAEGTIRNVRKNKIK